MTASPHGIVTNGGSSYAEDEDQVVFKTPSEKNGTPSVSGFRQSSFPPASQRSYGESGGQVNGAAGSKTRSPESAGAQWNVPQAGYNDADQGWAVPDGDHHANGNAVLGPAAEIKETGQPHSRQSSAGDSSSFDSPALPTPGNNNTKTHNGVATGKHENQFGPNASYYAYDGQEGLPNGINGIMNGHMSPPPMPGQGMYNLPMSPVMGGGAFSPPMMVPGDGRQAFGMGADGFSINYGMQQGRMPARGGVPARANPANSATAFPTLNGQQQAQMNAAAFGYGSPPNPASLAYNAGLMSPTLQSPTFMPTNPYSPIHAPTPYSPYAANPQALPGANGMYDMMSPMSPSATAAMLANRGGQVQARGHGYSASQPTALRDASQGMVSPRATQGRPGPQPQNPRGAPNQVHAHSMSMSQLPYSSPQLTGIPYGHMSPPPFGAYYPPVPQQQQQLSPEIIQAMAGLAINAAANGQAAAYNPQVQSALNGLQQDPSVLALIQQGGGPSANNRKLGLYKTELCRSWEEKGTCKYGEKCQFAHGEAEQRRVERHPKYKTEICRTFWVSGSCPYGKRCCFIHTELPGGAAGAAGGAGGEGQRSANTPTNAGKPENAPDGRARSMSTNSDPNEQPSSLLARISARAQANNSTSPVGNTSTRSGEGSPNGGLSEAVIASAIARAYSAYGMPGAGASQGRESVVEQPVPQPPQQQQQQQPTPQPQAPSPSSFGFPTRNTSTPSGGLGGGHHRVSASMDFGRPARNLGSDLSVGLGSGLGHQVGATGLDSSSVLTRLSHKRNPSASSVVPSSSYTIPGLSRTPISGQSTPFGGANETSSVRGVAVGSSLLDPSPW